MMDRNYPSSSFADALAAPAQTAASWAYDRGSASVKPSPNYGAAHLDGELLQQQSYTSTHQPPTYTTTHIPAAARTLESSGNTPVTSIMSFLSAMEPRSLQAGPVSASLLPPFRPPSWPTGTNTSTTELYLTGALPSTATFPSPAALSSFQHTGAYPSRNYATNSSLTLQDPAFNTSTNGLFSHHDPLLHLKPSQAVLPTALAFNHLSTSSLGSALPVQSSTYRSAQESAPHLLQPQFSLLPSALPAPHGAPQPYGATIFSNSIERALQRECSVIKHHQRPSSSHMASEELPNSEHSLQGYYGTSGEADVSYQEDPSRHTPVSCSPSSRVDSTQVVSGSPQPKTDCTTQAYSSTSLLKGKDCSSKIASHSAGDEESHSQNLRTGSPERYPAQKHNSVIASQQEVQLSNLLSNSLSQSYITPHTEPQTSHSPSEKLSSLYTTLPSLSSHSDCVASVGQTLVYSSTPRLNQEQGIQYIAQVQNLCQNFSESYPTSHSQGALNMTFTSQSQEQGSVTRCQSYNTGQSLNSVYSPTCVQSLPSNSTVDSSHLQDSLEVKTHNTLSQQQTQTQNVLSVSLPTYSSPAQSLQNAISPSVQDIKPIYAKQKLEELPLHDIVALQQVPMVSVADNSMVSHNNVIYVVSKMDDHKPQSVIRSNSRSDEQFLGHSHTDSVQLKDEQIGSVSQQQICLNGANGHEVANVKTTNSTIVPSHIPLCSEQLKQPPVQLRSPESHQQNQQINSQNQSSVPHSQFISLPSSQVLLEPNQMILVQQPLVHHSENASKFVSVQGIHPAPCLGPVHVQYLQMDRDLLSASVTETQIQQATVMSEPRLECSSSSKHHYSQSAGQQPNDAKNQFTLNSICFPDSMLLADDRNILSNVDDILAATVAACGVTPQDFVKAASSAEVEMAEMSSPVDSKGHLQTVDIRQMSPSFSSAQHPVTTNTNSYTISMTLNGAQIATDCQGQLVHHSSSTDHDTNGNGRSSENGYHSVSQVFDPSGVHNQVKGNAKCAETNDVLMECPVGEDSSKKKARSKSSTKAVAAEDDRALGRPGKRSGQAKRQNSRGSDVSSPSAPQSTYDGCPQQERIRQKIREVEEKQPEVKTGFIGSFLDFIKSGPKQHHSQSPARSVNRPRKPSTSSKLCTLPPKVQTLPGPMLPQESPAASSQSHPKRLDEDLQKNLETLPSFSSDEEENTGKNQALRNRISSALSSLDEATDRKTRTDTQIPSLMMKPDQLPTTSLIVTQICLQQVPTPALAAATIPGGTAFVTKEEFKVVPSDELAVQLMSVAMEGLTDEELSDSGGEGMYRERDEFVVRKEDVELLKVTMRAGTEPPAIWKVQKALLQKFVPELRDGKRVFSATNSYLGYFGDARNMYHRVYVKFLDTVNKREYVRVCTQKPRCKPMNSLRGAQVKTLLGLTALPSSVFQNQKPRPKQTKPRAEPPPKKRRKWKEEFSPTVSGSSAEEGAADDELNPPLTSRPLNTRTMKETFRSFVELLISAALDEDVLAALEKANDELLLPYMKRVDGMITDNRKRLLNKLHIGQVLKTALDSFPEIAVVTELKKDRETPAFKVRLSGKAYNKKTMKSYKMPNKVPQEYTVDQQKTQWFSLYHSLQHYKYHTYLMCKDEIASLRIRAGDLGQEETVQKCLQNGAWVEGLFDRFGELISQVQQVCT